MLQLFWEASEERWLGMFPSMQNIVLVVHRKGTLHVEFVFDRNCATYRAILIPVFTSFNDFTESI
jgi:hypothetical protein